MYAGSRTRSDKMEASAEEAAVMAGSRLVMGGWVGGWISMIECSVLLCVCMKRCVRIC